MRGRQKQRVTLSKFIRTYNFNRFLSDYSIITKKQFRQIYELMKMIQLDSVTMGNIQSIVANLIKYNVDCNYYDRYILLNTQYNKKNNLESYVLRYGEFGKQLYNEKNKSTAITKENMINKHGESLGLKKWESYCSKHKFIGTINFYIEKFGKDLGPIEYKKSCEMRNSFRPELFKSEVELTNRKSLCKISLDKMISKYGLTEGTNKYNDYNKWLTEDKCRTPSQVGYWVKQGFSEDEAKIKVKAHQATGSLENFKKRYGDELGKQKWTERQVKWQATLNSKTDEEKIRINKAKALGGINSLKTLNTQSPFISKPEVELCQELKKHFDIEQQFCINYNINHYFYDIKYKNKIIEFNGDFWHCNPSKYKSEYFNKSTKLTAKQTWENDNNKQIVAKDNGFEIFIVWEQDFKTNKQECIDKCIKFLSE